MKRQARQVSSYRGKPGSGNRWTLVVIVTCLILGALCFVVPGVRFSGYLFFGLALMGVLWMLCKYFAEISKWGKWCKGIFLVCVLALFVLLSSLEILIISESGGDDGDIPVDAVIVLGAGVNGETPSLSLQTRIDAAADYLKAHPELPAVLSGGQGSGERITEAEAMRRALREAGIAEERLLLEEQSTNTAENFAYSAQLLRQQGIDPQNAVIAVVSNDFHLFRAKLIAQREGITAVGVSAKLQPWFFLEVNYFIRESFASVKTLLFD